MASSQSDFFDFLGLFTQPQIGLTYPLLVLLWRKYFSLVAIIGPVGPIYAHLGLLYLHLLTNSAVLGAV
jgi:hypothetical protein